MKKNLIAALGLALVAVSANAQFTVDGTRDAAYPDSTVFQTSRTSFGDSTNGTISTAGGSELDGVFAELDDDFLNIIFTGNLETNFNRLVVFFDAPGVTTGTNVVDGSGVFGDFDGLTFDTGFAPDFALVINGGNTPTEFFLDFGTLAGVASTNTFFGGTNGQNGGVISNPSATPAPSGFLVAVNNSNIAGVTGSSAAGASAVTTGVEFQIPTSLIGNVNFGSGVLVSAFISGGNFLSNQVLGGVPDSDAQLGTASGVNFNNIAGNQFFAVPEPATMAALGFGALALLRRRRKSA